MHSYFIPLVFASGRRRRRSLRHAAVLVLLAAAAFVAASTPGLARDPLPAHTAQVAVPATAEVTESVPSVAPIAANFSEQQTAAWAGAQGNDHWLRDSALRTSLPLAPAANALPSPLPPQEQGTWEHLSRAPPAPGGQCA